VERAGLNLVGAVDIDPAKVGRDAGEVIGLGRPLALPVVGTLSQALAQAQADVVIHTTSSYFDLFKGQIVEILEAGLDIVSTSEELSFPWLDNPQEAAEIDAVAKRAGKTVLGTGVNPGFLMDALPLSLTAICQQVDRIDVRRVINASTRRGPFQAKIGSGMSVEAFEAKMAAGRMGHVGLPESMGMLFDTLGRDLVRYESSVEPVVADRAIKTDHFEVQPGQVRGLKQVAQGYSDEGEFATLTFIAALDEEDDGDTITLSGRPDLVVKLKGTNGDIATVAIAVNAVRRVLEAAPGVVTMRDLPLISIS
jgi:4-hydroxy-tetrahydrodipicolinate reductase